MVSKYEDLDVFKKSYRLAIEIHNLTLTFPDIEKFSLSSQIRRSSKSICANIVEGFAKQSHSANEFKRFLKMSLGSSEETRLWLKFSKDLGYITNDLYQKLNQNYLEITRMLQGLIKNWKS